MHMKATSISSKWLFIVLPERPHILKEDSVDIVKDYTVVESENIPSLFPTRGNIPQSLLRKNVSISWRPFEIGRITGCPVLKKACSDFLLMSSVSF